MRGRFATPPARTMNNTWLLTLEVKETPTEYDQLKDDELRIEIKKYSKKRSLDANAYCWVLCTEMADKLKTSKDEVYEEMIQRYAPYDQDDDGYITVTMIERIPVSKLGGHWKLISKRDGFNIYMKLVGSSEMDTTQMAHFIDGIISEAKELGIQTETPEEIERIKSLWKAS